MRTDREKLKHTIELELKNKGFVFGFLIPFKQPFKMNEWILSSWELENGRMFHQFHNGNKIKRCVQTKDGSYYHLISKKE